MPVFFNFHSEGWLNVLWWDEQAFQVFRNLILVLRMLERQLGGQLFVILCLLTLGLEVVVVPILVLADVVLDSVDVGCVKRRSLWVFGIVLL